MSKGSRGELRPADTVGRAVTAARVATGEIEDSKLKQSAKRKGGIAGAKARATVLEPKKRQQMARRVAKARWAAKRSDA